MRPKRLSILMRLAGPLLAAATLTCGCIPPIPGITAPIPEGSLNDVLVVGGTAERTVLMQTRWPDPFGGVAPADFLSGELGAELFEYEPPDTEFVRVNLRTLETQRLNVESVVDSFAARTDGTWLAWQDWEQAGVHVFNMDTGEQTTHFGDAASRSILSIAALRDPYLVLQAGPPTYLTTALVVINLETDEQLFISPALLVEGYIGYDTELGSVAVAGDRLAMHVWETLESAEDLDRPLTSTIDLIDLTSGERSVLVENLDGEVHSALRLEADGLLLFHSPYAAPTTVRSFPLDGGDPLILAQFTPADSFAVYSEVETFNTHGLLIRTSVTGPTIFGNRELFDFRTFDGATTRMFEHTYTPFSYIPFSSALLPAARLIDEFVVYQDSEQPGFVVVDVTTQTERRFDPFGR